MQNINEITQFYENEGQEALRLHPDSIQVLEYQTAQKYLSRFLSPKSKVLDSCAGTGVYAFWLAGLGHCVTAGDLVDYNVDIIQEKQQENSLLEAVYQGNATDLSAFEDGHFDAVLCMGALYHMQEEEERRLAIAEGMRVLRSGGLFCATYMNRYAVITNNLQPDMGNIDEVLAFAKKGVEGIYYAATATETEELMAEFGLQKCCHVALDGPVCLLAHNAGLLNAEGFEKWKTYHFLVCEDQSLLGSSYHNLYIGKK